MSQIVPAFRRLAIVAAAIVLAACAHPISMAPDTQALAKSPGGAPSKANVGYYISDAERASRVVTPGGGGDKVEYSPYKDLEPGLYHVLNDLFTNVYLLKSMDDQAFVVAKGITIVFRPRLVTNSSSASIVTWPPTEFTVIIDIKATDRQGKVVWEDAVTGKGQAEFDEFKSDFGLAAKRASTQALAQLREKILASPLMR